eukprot:3346710-Pleurochrysis_carterae.AAC.2
MLAYLPSPEVRSSLSDTFNRFRNFGVASLLAVVITSPGEGRGEDSHTRRRLGQSVLYQHSQEDRPAAHHRMRHGEMDHIL